MKPMTILLASLLAVSPAWAGGNHSFVARAKVVNVEPEYRWVRVNRPETHCWDEAVYEDEEYGDILPMIVGGAVGGALGHQVGGGRGKDVATVAGAIAGTVIGHRMSDHRRVPRKRYERRCETENHWVEERERVGYRVRYKFAGRTFTTLMDQRPGKWIDVRVNLDPLE